MNRAVGSDSFPGSRSFVYAPGNMLYFFKYRGILMSMLPVDMNYSLVVVYYFNNRSDGSRRSDRSYL